MTSRTDTIAAVLRHPQPVRQLLGHEMRGSVVQLLGPGTTDPTWQATPQLLAEEIDAALTRAVREEKDIPQGTASTARAEILAVLQAAGYNQPAAAELLARAYREPQADQPSEASAEALAGGHALVIEFDGSQFLGSCQCGRRLGRITSAESADALSGLWERHTLTELPTSTVASNGAS